MVIKKNSSNSNNKAGGPSNRKTIALIGGGYKGINILKWLEREKKFPRVIYFNHKKPNLVLKKTKFYRLDLTETLADVKLAEIFKKEEVDTLIHTAIPVTPPKNISRAHELISVGSMYLCNAAAEAKLRKLVLASTADVYGAFANNPNYLNERHPPRAGAKSRFLADKIDAENRFLKYAEKNPKSIVTILRPASILGPSITSYKTQYLSRWFVPTVLGYDPLVQFIHEKDFMDGFKLSILNDCPGIFNLASRGVIPLSKAIKLMGKINIPMSLIGLKTFVQLLWYANISPAPASFLDRLKYIQVVNMDKAEKEMNYRPQFNCKEALLDFVGAQRLRGIHLEERWEG